MTNEPTDAQLLASFAGIALAARQLIDRTDRTSFTEVTQTLDAIHEHLAVAGGSMLYLAKRMGCEAEVERLIQQGQDRVAALRASRGLGGRA